MERQNESYVLQFLNVGQLGLDAELYGWLVVKGATAGGRFLSSVGQTNSKSLKAMV